MLNRRQQGEVAILTIDRSNRRNALGTELMRAFSDAFVELDRDDSVAAIVISATAPGFCAGSDLKELAMMNIAEMCAHEAETARVVRAIGFMEKPVDRRGQRLRARRRRRSCRRLRPDRHPSRMPLAHAGSTERLAAALGARIAQRAGRTGHGEAAGMGKRADHRNRGGSN